MARYEIRIAHPLDETMAAAFEGFEVTGEGEFTVVSGEFDQAALHGTLERIRMLRWTWWTPDGSGVRRDGEAIDTVQRPPATLTAPG